MCLRLSVLMCRLSCPCQPQQAPQPDSRSPGSASAPLPSAVGPASRRYHASRCFAFSLPVALGSAGVQLRSDGRRATQEAHGFGEARGALRATWGNHGGLTCGLTCFNCQAGAGPHGSRARSSRRRQRATSASSEQHVHEHAICKYWKAHATVCSCVGVQKKCQSPWPCRFRRAGCAVQVRSVMASSRRLR